MIGLSIFFNILCNSWLSRFDILYFSFYFLNLSYFSFLIFDFFCMILFEQLKMMNHNWLLAESPQVQPNFFFFKLKSIRD